MKYGRPIRQDAPNTESGSNDPSDGEIYGMFPKLVPLFDPLGFVDMIRLTVKAPIFTLVTLAGGVAGAFVVFSTDPFWLGVVLLFGIALGSIVIGIGLQRSVNRWIRRHRIAAIQTDESSETDG